MTKIYCFLLLCFTLNLSAQDTLNFSVLDSINATFTYQTGKVTLRDDVASINVPKGFKFLNDSNSWIVLEKLWGNQADNTVLGMLFPERYSPIDSNCWAFVVTYEAVGFVKDEDADDINYDELLTDMQADVENESKERVALGYSTIALIGWGATPFYDKERKALHWAKEIEFDSNPNHTLNYNIRLLGRKGVLQLNAVGVMPQLAEIKENINPVIASAEFNEGYKYSEFDPDIDEVAAYTIGGLIAGKILLKVGFWAAIIKFWKLIGVAIIAAGAYLRRLFKRKKEKGEETNLPTTINDSGN